MWEKVLPIIGGIFAGIGIILILFDVITSIKRRDKTRTNIAGLVLLSVAVIGYLITDVILKDSSWPALASLVWIALFWAYVIIDACVTLGAIKTARRNKRKTTEAQEQTEQEQTADTAEQSEQEQSETPVEQTPQQAKPAKKKNRKKQQDTKQ